MWEAFKPLMTALVNPFASISLSPLMVMPPGVVTLSISTSGCESLAANSATAPCKVCMTASLASCGERPISTPPFMAARMYCNAYAMPHEDKDIKAFNWASGTKKTFPNKLNIELISCCCDSSA